MSGLDQHRVESPLGSDLLGLAILIAAFAALAAAAAALEPVSDEVAGRMLLSFGAIGIWRYTWAGIHVARALIYQLAAFPRLRTRVAGAPKATHVYVVVLSYRMAREVNAAVYSALVRDLEDYQRPATVIACVSDPADADTLRHVKLGKGIELIALQQSDHGKREAMERALNLLGARPVPSHSCLVLMDGDTIVPIGTLRRVAPVLTGQPDVGAVTTNNIAAVDGAPRIREWYRLRMQQRHLLMSSMSLSRKVLVLTGRWSLFRADLALSPAFIAFVGHDAIHHRRLGRIKMLTGDDKSTWFCVLRSGWSLLYVPDTTVVCLEQPPARRLVRATIPLMVRYYGNMARNNGRAVALGPRRLGWFVWWTLVDQRMSPWTSLIGSLSALALSLRAGPAVLILYLGWVLLSRSVQSLVVGAFGGRVHPYMPLILYFNQVAGSMIKILLFFHPDRQKWTRQGTGTTVAAGRRSSSILMWLWSALFALLIAAAVAVR